MKGEEITEVPSPSEHLKQFLRMFGLSERDASAVVEYLKPYGFDNLLKLDDALTDVGVSLSRRRLIVEAWSNLRGLTIPGVLLRRLRIGPYSPELARAEMYGREYGYPYGYGSPYGPPYTKRGSEVAEVVSAVAQLLQTVQSRNQSQRGQGDSSLVSELISRVQQLEEKLREKDLEILRKEIDSLKNRLNTVSNQYDVLITWIRQTGGAFSKWLIAQGLEPVPKPKQTIARKEIFDLIPPEYVEEVVEGE